MTPAQQEIVQQVSFEAAKRDRDQVLAAGGTSISTLKAKGVKFHDFPAGDAAKWKAANPNFFGDFIKNQDKPGRGDAARKTIKIWRDVVKQAPAP